jgi:hypothetical protein
VGRGANNAALASNDGFDRGQQLFYYSTAEKSAFIGYDQSLGKLIAAQEVGIINEVVTVSSYGTFLVGALEGTTVSVTGNITGGNVLGGANVNATTHTGTTVSVTGNITGGNILTAGLISATGNITGGNVLGGANVNATTHTGTTVSVTGNITGGNLNAAGLNLSGNVVSAINASSSIAAGTTISAAGNIIGGNIIVSGVLLSTNTVSATGNITGGNIRTAGLVSATGNVIAAQFNGSGAGLSSIPGGNVTGTVASATTATTATSATTAGTVTTAAQPNITSLGSLTSLIIPVASSNPVSPAVGQFYYNSSFGVLRVWTGFVWDDV